MADTKQKKLKQIVTNLFSIPDGKFAEASMKTVKSWDSLKHIELMMSLEEEFNVGKIPPKDIAKLTSVPSIQQYLRSKRVAA